MKINFGLEVPIEVEFRNFGKLLQRQIESSKKFNRKPSTLIVPGYRRKGDKIILGSPDCDLAVLKFPSKKLAKIYDEILICWTAREDLVRKLVREYREFLKNEFELVKTWEEIENGRRKD